MSDNYDEFFQGTEGEQSAPREPASTAPFKSFGDKVQGEIVDMHKEKMRKYQREDYVLDDEGNPKQHLVITVQTDRRNWEGSTAVPKRRDPVAVERILADGGDVSDAPLVEIPAAEDTGRRRLYVKPRSNLQFGIGRATGGKAPKLGDLIQVTYVSDRVVSEGTAKQYDVKWKQGTPPVATDADFATPAAPAAPAPVAPVAPAAPAAPAQDPWAAPPPAAAAPAATDPWGAPAGSVTTDPPF